MFQLLFSAGVDSIRLDEPFLSSVHAFIQSIILTNSKITLIISSSFLHTLNCPATVADAAGLALRAVPKRP